MRLSSGLFPVLVLVLQCSGAYCGFFWQVTDMHVDTFYDPLQGDPSSFCHKHHPGRPSSEPYNLSSYGDFRCDAPLNLIERTISGMREIHGDPDFILWNGDSSTHIGASEKPPPMSYVTDIERKIVDRLKVHFPSTRILPILGNHDSSPPDFFPDTNKDANTTFYSDYFRESNWSRLLTVPREQEEFSRCGFYGSESHGLRFLLLNTNLYYQNNNTGRDPCNQLSWLMGQLESAPSASVVLGAHVPPGYYERTAYGPFMMTKDGDYHINEFYIDILTKYSDRIFAQFYGHTHSDSFRLFGYPHNVSSVAFIAPSVTPKVDWVSGTFPSVRLYEYDPAHGLLNYKEYYFNITEGAEKPLWKVAYDFREIYGTQDLSPKSLLGVFKMISSDPSVFNRYYELNTVFHKEAPCDSKCKIQHLCGLSQVRVQGMKDCLAGGHRAFPLLRGGEYQEESLFRLRLSPLAEFGIYVVLIAPLCGFLLSFAYLIRSRRRIHIGKGYRTVPLSEEI